MASAGSRANRGSCNHCPRQRAERRTWTISWYLLYLVAFYKRAGNVYSKPQGRRGGEGRGGVGGSSVNTYTKGNSVMEQGIYFQESMTTSQMAYQSEEVGCAALKTISSSVRSPGLCSRSWVLEEVRERCHRQ